MLELLTGKPPVVKQVDLVSELEDVMYEIFEDKREADNDDGGTGEAAGQPAGPSSAVKLSTSERVIGDSPVSWQKLVPHLDHKADWPLAEAVELLRIARMCLQPRRTSRWGIREALPHLEALAGMPLVQRASPGQRYDSETGELLA